MPVFQEYNSKQHKKTIGPKGIVIDSAEAMEKYFEGPAEFENIYIAKDMAQRMKIRIHADEENVPPEHLEAFRNRYGGFAGFVQTLAAKQANNAHHIQARNQDDDSHELDNAHSEIDSEEDPEDELLDQLANTFEDDPEEELGLSVSNHEQDDLFTSERESILYARERNAPDEMLTERRFNNEALSSDSDQADLYVDYFGGDEPFLNLASYIQSLDDSVRDMPGHGQTYHFKRHLDSILPIVALAVNGARKEYQASQDLDPAEKIQVRQKMEAFEAIQGMFLSMRAHANNKSRYTEGYYENKMIQMLDKLDELGVNEEARDALLGAFNQVVHKNLVSDAKMDRFYQHKKGSTGFDASGDKMEIKGHEKRVKIEHHKSPDSKSNIVTGKFSYSRKSVIGVETGHFSGVKKIFAQQKDQRKEMNAQVSDFVTAALIDFQKGTDDNRIYLQPSKGNQSELCLAILLEFKKRAILEGKELIASDDNGKRIVISPQTGFSPNEREYFESFAMQVPKVAVGRGKQPVEAEHCAGYQLLQEVELNGKPLKGQTYSKDTIVEAMSQHLSDSVKAHIKEQEKAISETVKDLPQDAGMRANITLR